MYDILSLVSSCIHSQKPTWFLPEHKFSLWNSAVGSENIDALSAALSKAVNDVWEPTSLLAIDETVFAYEGNSPVRVYIPRKPHPNGLLSYGMCTWVYVAGRKLPVLLDTLPFSSTATKMSAQESMMELVRRFVQVPSYHPASSSLHLFVGAPNSVSPHCH